MVTIKAKQCKTVKESMIGLLGKSTPSPLFFKTRFGIHTCGLQFPIDVVILTNTFRVVVYKKSLIPWRFFFWNPIYYHVLELPAGTIEKEGIQLGEQIKIIFQSL